ncbi:hypothetical protein DNH61_17785 [Paenibacillus sambharensis]|uniref:Oxidoreductase molybdopterin-binding domain-containing protein n=1 Tax=Paenibacillus sambharensis TaxID=1803190 RepID=A0A2W1LS35_9BACL|nr:hypothetical protein [Paenibacillus sambharensis]PZD94267.1 hypothetical protein DNH61_17785 [Paenibacillus sambharensis]
MHPRSIRIEHFGQDAVTATAEAMAIDAGRTFPAADRVPEAAGDAFDWLDWYRAWAAKQGLDREGSPEPTHLQVEAADSFEAVIPWSQLRRAAVVYAVNGQDLGASGPLRLYVPDGISACLNVKRVTVFRIGYADGIQPEASYGFKSQFTPGDLMSSLRKA